MNCIDIQTSLLYLELSLKIFRSPYSQIITNQFINYEK